MPSLLSKLSASERLARISDAERQSALRQVAGQTRGGIAPQLEMLADTSLLQKGPEPSRGGPPPSAAGSSGSGADVSLSPQRQTRRSKSPTPDDLVGLLDKGSYGFGIPGEGAMSAEERLAWLRGTYEGGKTIIPSSSAGRRLGEMAQSYRQDNLIGWDITKLKPSEQWLLKMLIQQELSGPQE